MSDLKSATPMDLGTDSNGGHSSSSTKPSKGGKSGKNPAKQLEKASSTEMASRVLAKLGAEGFKSPPTSIEDMLLPAEDEGKTDSQTNSDLLDTVNTETESTASEDGENHSVTSKGSSTDLGSAPGGAAGQGSSSGKIHAAKGQGARKAWKGKFLDEMSEEELKIAQQERKELLERKREDRDETQAEWVRLVKPVVSDDDPGRYKRVLKTMGITEERIRSQGNHFAKLMDEGKKTLALILWVQQRDSTNMLIRYIMGQVVHEPATATQAATTYDPEVAIEEKSMQVKLLQLFVELAKRLTKKEAAMQHAQTAEKQAYQMSKNKRRWNKGGKGKEVEAKKPKPAATSSSDKAQTSGGAKPSGLFKGQAKDDGTGKRRYPSEENSAEKPPKKILAKETLTEALQNINLNGKNVVRKVKIPTSKVNTIPAKNSSDSAKKNTDLDKKEEEESCSKVIHPDCLHCSDEDDEVKVTYAKAAAKQDFNPFQNPDSIKVVRYVVEEGDIKTDLPGMSKQHWDGRLLPAMEILRKEENLKRLRNKETPIRAIKAQRHAAGRTDALGQPQPNFGLLLPFDSFNSEWLIAAINSAELSAGSSEKVYRYTASLAFRAGTDTCILSFKVNKIGSDVSEGAWEMFCFDNNIDSSWAKRMEPKRYDNETEVLFAANRKLVEQLKVGDDKVGRLPSRVLFGFQGQRQLLHKTKPLSDISMDKIQFQFGHI